jgi:DNA polymerase-1
MNFLMEKVEMPLVPVVAELEANGYLIDCDHFTGLKARLEPEKASILADIQAIGGPEFNPGSFKQVKKLLYEKLGLPVFKKTKKGGPSTDKESLDSLRDAHPVLGKILEFREIAKVLSTYCNFPQAVCSDSRLRSEYTQLGTVTGRLTAGVIHTLPKDDGFGIRNGFIAPLGFKIVGADFDQQELFILASMSGDPAMLDAISDGIDLHGLAAKRVFGLVCGPNEVGKLHPEKRGQVKAVQFGILYGSGAESLAKKLSLSLQAAKELIEGYFQVFPNVKSFIDKNHNFVVKNGYIVDVFGRIEPLPNAQTTAKSEFTLQREALREAQNFPIQAAGATITKLAMIQCHNHIREFHPQIKMVLTLHDELQFEVPDDEVEHFAAELPVLMTDLGVERFGFKIPFKVSVKSGQSWGTMMPHQPADSEATK